jgi:predicted nucleic acid-binding protein
LEELNTLRKRLEVAEKELEAVRRGPPPGTEDLAQGSDKITVPVDMGVVITDFAWGDHHPRTVIDVAMTWDEVLAAVGPELLDETSQPAMRAKLNACFAAEAYDEAMQQSEEWAKANSVGVRSHEIRRGAIYDDDFDTMLLQLRALGLIVKSERKRSVKDTGAYWTLTPYGEERLTALRAIRRDADKRDDVPSSAG